MLKSPDAKTESPVPPAAAPPPDDAVCESVQSEGLGRAFAELGVSLLITTYQAGKLVVARHDEGLVQTRYLGAPKPMGLAADRGRLALGVLGEIRFYADVQDNCARLQPPGRHDACFVERFAHVTGEIDIHEMAFGAQGDIWFVNTRFSALCTLQGPTSFVPVWRPPFITAYAAEDRCHLNGLGMVDGKPRYLTALGEADTRQGWRERKADGGVLIDLASNRTVCRGLSMPHSPRWHADRLWVCESGKGTLATVDPSTGAVTPFFKFPGFTRGLDFAGPLAFVGLSQIRESATFSGIPIAEVAAERNCGVWVVDITRRELVGVLRFTRGVHEIFAVQALPGLSFPEVLERDHEVALKTYFLPPKVAAEFAAAEKAAADRVPAAQRAET